MTKIRIIPDDNDHYLLFFFFALLQLNEWFLHEWMDARKIRQTDRIQIFMAFRNKNVSIYIILSSIEKLYYSNLLSKKIH
jgi:hypothetical protein